MAVSKMQDNFSKGSSEYHDNLHCDMCFSAGKQVNAMGHCSDCVENLCKECMEYHTAIKVCVNHKLLCEPKKLIFCKTCERLYKRMMPSGFCLDCRESLCPSCYDYHPRPSATRDHRLVKEQELSEKEIVTMLSRVKKVPNVFLPTLTAENIDLCVPCLTKSKDVTARRYCKTCMENFCEDCYKYHNAIAGFSKHDAGYEEIDWCKPCARRSKRSAPSMYCWECKESLCAGCCDYHKWSAAAKTHNLQQKYDDSDS